ncbi:MAG: hypothetical protein KAW19_10570 [Candidatus Aminicenantes bacterium]|nr:hypothetical protein [Candidatus Aminicenantes bacterium]
MEEKYDPSMILRYVWGKYFSQAGHENSESHEYQISIKIKGAPNECYFIKAKKDKPVQLWRGPYEGSLRLIKDDVASDALYDDRQTLGNTNIIFKGKSLKQFQSYEEFWGFIKNEK